MRVPLCEPCIGLSETEAVNQVLKSGWLTSGPVVAKFENEFADYIGCEFAVAVNSCASALFLVLKALGISGDIILPSFTHAATANAVVCAGAVPIFADIAWMSCNMAPLNLTRALAQTSEAQAVIVVHFAGQSCIMDEIVSVAKRNHLVVIEDSAEAVGAEYKGKKTGSFGTGCFSFFPTKNMTTGEGGMITTNDGRLAEELRLLRAHGVKSQGELWERSALVAGFNLRMSDILAAIGIEQLKKLDWMNEQRAKHAECYNVGLNEDFFWLPYTGLVCKHVYQMYTVKLKDHTLRNAFVAFMRSHDIEASVHFDPPVHRQPFYYTYRSSAARLPSTDRVASSIATLPMFPHMSDKQLEYVIRRANEFAVGGLKVGQRSSVCTCDQDCCSSERRLCTE